MIDQTNDSACLYAKLTRCLSLLSAIFLISFLGCGRAYFHQPDIDLASVDAPLGTASVLFECNGPEHPAKIIGHLITIDQQEPIFVENFSRQQVNLNAGRHTVSIVTIASDHPYAYQPGQKPQPGQYYEYGKKTETTFLVIESGALIARYTPPSNSQEAGRLWIL